MIDKNVFEFEIFSTRQYSAIVLEKQEKEEMIHLSHQD